MYAISSFASASVGYLADFADTNDGRMVLVEINDERSLGSYRFWHDLYTQLLFAC